jgi:hypothetical protein
MTRRLIVLATFAYCMALYPAVLQRTQRTGADAPIYWQAGRGNTEYIADRVGINVHRGWVYSDRLLPALRLPARLPYWAFLLLLHTANSIGVACLMAAIINRTGTYPIVAGAAAFMVGAKASDIVANGNVTGLLAGLSLTPWGAVLASAVKPWYGVAVLLHAAAWAAGRGRRPFPRRIQG